MTHNELDRKVQELWNSAPIKWAFGIAQEKAMLKEWGLEDTKESWNNITYIGNGGYVLDKDMPRVKEISAQAKKMTCEFYDNNPEELAKKAIYEFNNYECSLTHNPNDPLDAIPCTMNEKNKEIIRKQWKKYCRKYSFDYYDPFTIPNLRINM